ncbi:rod shape-determining protein MreC, partial [Streptomyces sp. NPDC047970]|uniref:rod shape-determining protein MreC n=1 Tax=Streptomyces sp. NPDC047970 TaxID=3155481 RepID=UPI003425F5C6
GIRRDMTVLNGDGLVGRVTTVGPRTSTVLLANIGEEFGEVAEALHGALGANPRKGASHGWEDVERELCDVIVTAMVALHTLGPDAPAALRERLGHLVDRAGV